MLFPVPELSPSLGMELSPNNPLITTPVGVHASLRPALHAGLQGGLLATASMIDPLHILKTHDLPDFAQGLPEPILHQMWDLIGSLSDDGTGLWTLGSAAAAAASADQEEDELPPNLDLLDPSNTAKGQKSYTMSDTAWIHGDPMENLATADVGRPKASDCIPQPLVRVAQRYALHEPPATLLAMLRRALVDYGAGIRRRQFWALLEGGNVSDFVLLAHLALSAREAQLSNKIALQNPHSSIEAVCFEAARREWANGRAEPTPATVFALLLLSEYGYNTGRTAVMWEFVHNALTTARRIVIRGTPFPWHGARRTSPDGSPQCDVELEHVLGCYWLAWLRVVLAAQTMTRRVDPSLYMQPGPSGDQHGLTPELPTHDMCYYTAQPVVPPGNASPDTVTFPSSTPCKNRLHHTYSAHVWQSVAMAVEIHNLYIDVLGRRCTPDAFLDAVRQWEERLQRWRATWPAEWDVQMDDMLAAARCINDEEHGGRLVVEDMGMGIGRGSTSATPVDRAVYIDRRQREHTVLDVGLHQFRRSPEMTEDTLLLIMAFAYEMLRLRMHRIALALLQYREPGKTPQGLSFSFADTPIGQSVDEQVRRVAALSATSDLLRDSIELHRCQYVCLEAARSLQSMGTVAELLGVSMDQLGMVGISALELAIPLHCARLKHSSDDTATQMDALRRLGRLMHQLLTLRHWTSALYIFTAVVKMFVDPACTIAGCCADIAGSPWPRNHVLTLLMHEMDMDPRQFCAFTVPVVYASVASTSIVPPSMRMRITSLLS
ncbi:hypothetical protein LPJ61_001913 [Coemansia biformis]|uniref:Transcription factor domain-containing protein n=1 Tax=Coemansia biformis TaxID=1286918 RepID=A0A9W7YF30_9FUNG|nr:hypothetical protein LPJ61_001913 [Coemansia biformis]